MRNVIQNNNIKGGGTYEKITLIADKVHGYRVIEP